MDINNNNERHYLYFDFIMTLFVIILVISNITSSAKIIDWGFSIYGMRMAFDAGTLLFPISYIFGDILTEVYGFQKSRRVIWAGFFCLAFSSIIFWIVKILPGEATWQQYAGQSAYNSILGGMSTGGIVLASLMGYWSGEFSNSIILAKMKIITNGKWLWMRTLGSTVIGQIFDTVVFIFLATLFGVFPWNLLLTLIVSNYIFKCLLEALMTPLTYIIVRKLKLLENEDYYDRMTDFNPFHIMGKKVKSEIS
jgi:uncharacterized integral membrane protein (TIGR00697 family)